LVLAAGGLLAGVQPAYPETLFNQVCMQTNYNNQNGSQNLNCNANDVRVATAIQSSISISSGGECHIENGVNKCTCDPSGDVTFTADFEVLLTAQARYDYGIYWATDGDANGDGALTGTCSITTATGNCAGGVGGGCTDTLNVRPSGYTAGGITSHGFTNESVSGDTCGDIDAAHNPQLVNITLTTKCTAGANNQLKLPFCTSWRQPGSNEVCGSPLDAFPGSPSKCSCNPGFTIGIQVLPTGSGAKCVTGLACASVGYKVEISNTSPSPHEDVTLSSLSDDRFGVITSDHGVTASGCGPTNTDPCEAVANTTCATGGTIVFGTPYSCTFDGVICELGSHTNNITAGLTGKDTGKSFSVGPLTATVTVNDVTVNSQGTCTTTTP
jgi:hypothetical protein